MTPKAKVEAGAGAAALHLWFELSYASWLTLPRAMMQEMPDAWQADMARLLSEWTETWTNQPAMGTRVQTVDLRGRLVKTPEWLINYRRPDRERIAQCR